jgi:hypothetical protein
MVTPPLECRASFKTSNEVHRKTLLLAHDPLGFCQLPRQKFSRHGDASRAAALALLKACVPPQDGYSHFHPPVIEEASVGSGRGFFLNSGLNLLR